MGSWRFASACLPDAAEGIRRLGHLYTEQNFAKGVTMAQISRARRRMLDDLLDGRDASILDNAHYRLNIMVVKSHGLLADDHRGRLGLGLSSVIADNLRGRARLSQVGVWLVCSPDRPDRPPSLAAPRPPRAS